MHIQASHRRSESHFMNHSSNKEGNDVLSLKETRPHQPRPNSSSCLSASGTG